MPNPDGNEFPREFIQLLLRSDDQGDGWRNVSVKLSDYVVNKANETLDLFEMRFVKDQFQIRLSPEGKTVVEWMI